MPLHSDVIGNVHSCCVNGQYADAEMQMLRRAARSTSGDFFTHPHQMSINVINPHFRCRRNAHMTLTNCSTDLPANEPSEMYSDPERSRRRTFALDQALQLRLGIITLSGRGWRISCKNETNASQQM
jgi:hypothetical protein